MSAGIAVLKVVVTPLTTTNEADGAKEIVLPSTVIARPGSSVCPLITNDDPGFATNVVPAITISGVVPGDTVTREDVAPLITMLEGASEKVVPSTVIGGPLGTRVCPDMTKVDPELATIVESPISIAGLGVMTGL